MKETPEESADLKMALKHDPETPFLRAEATAHPQEADEAVDEVERGFDTADPGSWVANRLAAQSIERRFTRTLITLVVLSEEPIPEDETLESILEGADTGPYVLGAVGKTAVSLDYQAMRQELLAAGNDGSFFDLEESEVEG